MVYIREGLTEKWWCISGRGGEKVVYLREGGGSVSQRGRGVNGIYLREGWREKR